MTNPERRSARFAAWLPAAAIWAFLLVVAMLTTRSIYSPVDLAVIAMLYAAFVWSVYATALVLARFGTMGRLSSMVVVGLVLAWHLREQTRTEGVGATLWTVEGLSWFLTAAALLTLAFFAVSRAVGKAGGPHQAKRLAALWISGQIALLIMLTVVFFGSDTLRWHLLRHNKMVGTPAFHLFGNPVAETEGAAWARHAPDGATIDPPPVIEATAVNTELVSGGPEDGPGGAPDIVFVMLDTLRADALAAYAGDPAWMPTLNRLAEENLLFRDVLANASWTRPSVASFFTGLMPEEHGAVALRFGLSPDVTTIAELLATRGYRTAAFIANRRIVNSAAGFGRGFETFEPLEDPAHAYARADVVTARVSAWLRENLPGSGPEPAAERRPLFLYVHYLDPHTPYLSSGRAEPMRSPASHLEARGLYNDELSFLDAALAELFGILDGTLTGPRVMLVTADHGEEFGDHDGRGHAQTLYSEVLQIPAIVQLKGAGSPPVAGSVDAPLEGRDFFDLLARVGRPEPVDVRGWADHAARQTRFASVSFRKSTGPSSLIHYLLRPYRLQLHGRMIQRGRWRLIWSAFGPTRELYDLSNDADERWNLADGRPDIVDSLGADLHSTPRYWARPVPTDVSEAAIEELRALGYIR